MIRVKPINTRGKIKKVLWGIVSDGIPVLQDPKYIEDYKHNGGLNEYNETKI